MTAQDRQRALRAAQTEHLKLPADELGRRRKAGRTRRDAMTEAKAGSYRELLAKRNGGVDQTERR